MPEPPLPTHGPLARLAAFLDRARFLFVPLAMCALVAVGAHAAADSLGDLFLGWSDRVQGALDSLFSRWAFTEPLVELIGLSRRAELARLLALAFELTADVLLAIPMLSFDEKPGLLERARQLFLRAARRPTVLAWSRSLFACALSLAGAASVARLVHGAVALELRPLFGARGLGLPRAVGLVLLSWLILAFASRAALRALEHAERQSQAATTLRERILLGHLGSSILAPLALVAVLRAAPLASFLR